MADQVKTNLIRSEPRRTLSAVDLWILEGPDRGVHVRLAPGVAKIGTAARNEVRLTDPTVSRLHCEISVQADGIRIVDHGSSNGTRINGIRVRDVDLPGGAIVELGATRMRIEVADELLTVEMSRSDRFGEVMGSSAAMRCIYAILERVAGTDTTVLVQGETGTGKEAVARSIHLASRRARGPLVTVDCGAIAEHLVESELFGHVRGAFSGATTDRRGLFEEADGGTLFLDEIGELPVHLQPKLLRALETREVRRVGENTARPIDVRVLAATHRSLARSVNEGTFREDLYYRIGVVEIVLPPLRDRREDIATLARHFYRSFSGQDEPVPPAMLASLLHRAWPGNVRELRNFVERTLSLGWPTTASSEVAASRIPAAVLEPFVEDGLSLQDARARWTEHFEQLYLSVLLRRTAGNVTRAAVLAGVHRRTLQRMMVQHGVRGADGREPAAPDDEAEDGTAPPAGPPRRV